MEYKPRPRSGKSRILEVDVTEPNGETRSPGSQSYLGWILSQILTGLTLIGVFIIGGLVMAIVRRRFHWGAFLLGFLTCAVLLPVLRATVFFDIDRFAGSHPEVLFTGAVVVLGLAGAVIGGVGRRIGYYESYLLALVLAALVGVHFAVGWQSVLGVGPGARESFFDAYAARPPGFRYFGDMWIRSSVLCLVAGWLMSIVGGSLVYMYFADRLRRDRALGGGFELKVSLRHLLGSDRSASVSLTALVAVTGVALGVAALVAVTAVMSGYQQDVQDKILSTNAHLVVQKYGHDFTEHREIRSKVEELPDVVAASPFTFNEAMMSVGDRAFTILLKGIEVPEAADVTGIADNLCASLEDDQCLRYKKREAALAALADSVREDDGIPTLLVGAELARKLEREEGDTVLLSTPVGLAGARGNAPKRMRFKLGRTFRSGMYEFDSRLVYASMDATQRLMGMGDAVTGVELRVSQPDRVELASNEVLRSIGRYPYRTLDWRTLNEGIFRALSLQKIVFFLVLSFIIVVASFNIASTLFMAVVEKSAEIGVLKSMGARDPSIMKIFVMEGWFVGGVGTALGVILGLGVCAALEAMRISIAANVYMVDSLTVDVRPREVVLVAVSAMMISHLATLYPALKGAKARPVDAIRYE
ncbi:MAG: ABC transporter permease [Myxococcota bacterium]